MRRLLAYLRGPGMLALRVRYAGPIAFVRARLSPQGYLGLQLTLGALVLVAFSWRCRAACWSVC